MRRKATVNVWVAGLGCASIALCSFCGCSWREILPGNSPTLPNDVAVNRALKLCSLSEGDQPYHLILDITPPARSSSSTRMPDLRARDLRAQIEIYWLNPVTFRTEVRSLGFSQTRIVNGGVIDERNTGDFYPRWIQNFVDAILDPVPHAARLKKIPGAIPIGVKAHACISSPSRDQADQSAMAEICFQDAEPLIASGVDFTRSVWFDDFAPFGGQMIPRTLVNDLPTNLLLRGHISLLEQLPASDYSLLKAREFTPPGRKIQTTLVSGSTAQSLLASAAPDWHQLGASTNDSQSGEPMAIYIRTDRTGRVREAYRDSSDQFGLEDAAVSHAFTLRFKPLIVDGAPRQMEAPLILPSRATLAQNLPPDPAR